MVIAGRVPAAEANEDSWGKLILLLQRRYLIDYID
jgi:hypothetical protein